MRTLAIGDIHGCRSALDHLLNFVELLPGDQLITLGDYVDRGPDSKGVIDRLIELYQTGQYIALRGNHELMMLEANTGERDAIRNWLGCGGLEALQSYAPQNRQPTLEDVPATHWHFIRHSCIDWYEIDSHFFVHANVAPHLPLAEQTSDMLHWEPLRPRWFLPHDSGKTMVCGHTQQRSGLPLAIPGAVCIDTWAYGGGWLTCLDVKTGEFWQANELGDTRLGQV